MALDDSTPNQHDTDDDIARKERLMQSLFKDGPSFYEPARTKLRRDGPLIPNTFKYRAPGSAAGDTFGDMALDKLSADLRLTSEELTSRLIGERSSGQGEAPAEPVDKRGGVGAALDGAPINPIGSAAQYRRRARIGWAQDRDGNNYEIVADSPPDDETDDSENTDDNCEAMPDEVRDRVWAALESESADGWPRLCELLRERSNEHSDALNSLHAAVYGNDTPPLKELVEQVAADCTANFTESSNDRGRLSRDLNSCIRRIRSLEQQTQGQVQLNSDAIAELKSDAAREARQWIGMFDGATLRICNLEERSNLGQRIKARLCDSARRLLNRIDPEGD